MTNYILLVKQIAEKYGIVGRLMLCQEGVFRHLSEGFHKEIEDHALLCLSSVILHQPDQMDMLISRVNALNEEQYKRFLNNCRHSKYLADPVSIVSLN